jgi:transcription elongation factor Elf1
MKPLCPKCGAVMSQADYHKSNEDYFAVCLECDEDFYEIEIKDYLEEVTQ